MLFQNKLSLSSIFLIIFLAYVSYSLWSIIQLFMPPKCENKNCIRPLIEKEPQLKILIYTSTIIKPYRTSDVVLIHKDSPFNYKEDKDYELSVSLPRKVRSNGTMYLHILLTLTSVNSKSWASLLDSPYTIYASTPLTKYQIPAIQSYNLLKDNKDEAIANTTKNERLSNITVSHFISRMIYNILIQPVALSPDAIPYELGRYMRLTPERQYLPIIHVNEMNQRITDLVEITPEMEQVTLWLKYSPISYGKMRMMMQFEASLGSMMKLGFTEKDVDEVKGIFSDSNLYLLCITFVVATLHLVFDFLAFKNDISFWRGRENMKGISSTSVLWRLFAQIIIFFYLMEEKTSLLVLVPAGIGAFIELWKVTKAFHIKLNGWRLEFNTIISKEESVTKQFDSEAFRYLTYIMYPLCIIGALYSLLYMPHKSWYSWIINSLVNGVYAFGFLFMLPQLFINYKLKSVEHLPWRAFMYKAFNTFIDDLFAFIITMPTAHRVACFRDDVVFIIYLVQRRLYPVDKKRINEFGTSGEEKEKED